MSHDMVIRKYAWQISRHKIQPQGFTENFLMEKLIKTLPDLLDKSGLPVWQQRVKPP